MALRIGRSHSTRFCSVLNVPYKGPFEIEADNEGPDWHDSYLSAFAKPIA